jgi:Xaa-Pro aminopeptidase
MDGGAMAAAARERFGAKARLAIDDLPWPVAHTMGAGELVGAAAVLGPAKMCKTPDELACIRRAQQINEQAMTMVQPLARPGARQCDLSGTFLRRVFELGATSNAIDPIWQVMPDRLVAGPWTVHGEVAFPTPSTDRALGDGDVVWVDTGITYEGYASDFGRTWIAGDRPRASTRQRDQYRRWREVMDAVLGWCRPGATGRDLTRAATAANGGERPWVAHFYLAHGVGTDSAEPPLIGTDLGDAFDDQLVLAPGMVLVLEPIIWDDGASGYRSEDIIAITDDGWTALSDYPYGPYD